MASEAKLAVIGLGYVGLPVAMLAVEAGHPDLSFVREARWILDSRDRMSGANVESL
jgi:UDP-N-acetyl-D-mannosaminuronate dehydrogenase